VTAVAGPDDVACTRLNRAALQFEHHRSLETLETFAGKDRNPVVSLGIQQQGWRVTGLPIASLPHGSDEASSLALHDATTFAIQFLKTDFSSNGSLELPVSTPTVWRGAETKDKLNSEKVASKTIANFMYVALAPGTHQ
jgi:hypothetical protein